VEHPTRKGEVAETHLLVENAQSKKRSARVKRFLRQFPARKTGTCYASALGFAAAISALGGENDTVGLECRTKSERESVDPRIESPWCRHQSVPAAFSCSVIHLRARENSAHEWLSVADWSNLFGCAFHWVFNRLVLL
jgi:hypothetical protein